MKGHIFLSYASDDADMAQVVVEALEARGIRVWMAPRDIGPGEDYAGAIVRAIGASRTMILVYTARSNDSVHVRSEVERAVNKGVQIVPLRVEDVPLSDSLEYFLSSRQWIDAFDGPLDRHVDRLAASLSAPAAGPQTPLRRRRRIRPETDSPGRSRRHLPVLLSLAAVLLGALALVWALTRPSDPAAGVPSDPEPRADLVPGAGEDEGAPPRLVVLDLAWPLEGAHLAERTVRVQGTFDGSVPPGAIRIGEHAAQLRDGSFEGSVHAADDGPLTISVRCQGDGLTAEPVEREVVIDTTPPQILLLEPPAEPSVLHASRLVIRGRIEEDHLESLRIDGRPVPSRADGGFEHVVVLAPNASRTVRIEAADRAGNAATPVERAYTFRPRTLSVRVETPQAGALLASREVRVTGRIAGVDEPAEVLVNGTRAPVRQGAFEATIRAAGDGPFEIRAVLDGAGSPAAASEPRTVTIDSTGPVLTVDSPTTEQSRTTAHVVTVRGTVTDPHLGALLLNGEEVVVDDEGRFRWPVFVDSEQTSVLSLEAVDTAGNRSATVTRRVRHEPPAPGRYQAMSFHDSPDAGFRIAARTGRLVFVCFSRYNPP